MSDPELALCDWRLPPDSKLGELRCIREVDRHDGKPHAVFSSTRSSAMIYEVDEEQRSLRPIMHARIERGPMPREQVAVLLAYAEVVGERVRAKGDAHPVRERSVRGEPRPETDIERTCATCGASFLGLAPGKTGLRGIWNGLVWYCSTECAES